MTKTLASALSSLGLILSLLSATRAEELPGGWTSAAPREEIRPTFAFDAQGGPQGKGALVIRTGDSTADQGWLQKSFPVEGGKFVRFSALRQTEHVATPRRSAIARIVWQNAQGKAVLADVPKE